MSEEYNRDVFEKAKTYGSFNNWLTNIPEEDLQYLSDIGNQVSADKLEDTDTFSQMTALAMHFAGQYKMTEDELEKAVESLIVFISLELNVRAEKMTKEGIYSMVPGEDTAKVKLTDKGRKSVEDMLDKNKGKSA